MIAVVVGLIVIVLVAATFLYNNEETQPVQDDSMAHL